MDDKTTAPSEEAVDEFARAFAEFTSDADGSNPAETPDDAEAIEEDAAEPQEQEGSDEPDQEAADAPEGKQEAAVDGTQNPDDELTKLREQNARLDGQFKSANGRYQAAERRAQELEQRLRKLESNQQQNAPSPGTDEFRQSFPEIAEYIDQQAHIIQQLQGQVQGITATQYDAVSRHIESQEQELATAHPDWHELINGRGSDLQAFLDSPNITRQALVDFEANRTGIQDAKAAARFVTEFKKFIGIEPPVVPPSPGEQPDISKAQAALDVKRRRQLAGAVSPRNPSPNVNITASRGDSFDDGWSLGAGE